MSASSMPTREPVRLQRQREIDRGRRFADAALAAGDRDDVRGRRARAALPPPARAPACAAPGAAGRWARGGRRAAALRRSAPRSPRARPAGPPPPARPPCAAARARGPRSGSTSIAKPTLPSRTTTPRHHAERDDVAAAVGIGDACERVEDLLARLRPRPCLNTPWIGPIWPGRRPPVAPCATGCHIRRSAPACGKARRREPIHCTGKDSRRCRGRIKGRRSLGRRPGRRWRRRHPAGGGHSGPNRSRGDAAARPGPA